MALDIFFSEDVYNALMAADEVASSVTAITEPTPKLQYWLQGYRTALTTVALAFGLSPVIVTHRKETLSVLETPEIYGIIG